MKMSDKPHCLLTKDLKNMQTDFMALNVRSCSWQYSVQIFNNDCSSYEDKEITNCHGQWYQRQQINQVKQEMIRYPCQ